MQFKYFVAALVSASVVVASPAPGAEAAVEKRQLLSEIVDGVTSVFNDATSVGGDVIDGVTSVAVDVGDSFTSRVGEIVPIVTSVGGKAVTVITSVGGEAITLADEGAGVLTSKFGSQYHVATAAAGAEISSVRNNNAASANLPHVRSTLLIGAATVLGSALLGAFLIV
ncbi:helix-turn-helix transcription factor, AraC type [Coprinopsis marcescibilis]|uniref:Helix-turn-helix transcription factor, AraC type n=1 Tax=Coprinopsis marcescibilis TaxID=230819 RepID=A0A5C3LBD7_COPMA|nr:helix-turn-helix transcription factor, AraC type [Coprinopsis marcescibilis]